MYLTSNYNKYSMRDLTAAIHNTKAIKYITVEAKKFVPFVYME